MLQGLFDISKVDSFNLPNYFPSPNELKALEERNQDFILERIEILNNPPKCHTTPDSKSFAMFMRVLIEEAVWNHFGSETIDELLRDTNKKLKSLNFYRILMRIL